MNEKLTTDLSIVIYHTKRHSACLPVVP